MTNEKPLAKEEIIAQIIESIRRRLPDKRFQIFLFGSWAKNTALPESDIDIGVLGPEKIDEFLMMRIRSDIAGIPTLRRVDIVDLKNVDERFKQEVLSHAKLL